MAERASYSRLQTDRDKSMPSMLQFIYGRKPSDQSFDSDSADNVDVAREEFSVRWVVHRYEPLPVAIEYCAGQDLDKIVESCRSRLSEMRGKHPNTPPDGFLVLNGAGAELRRWFGSSRPPLAQQRKAGRSRSEVGGGERHRFAITFYGKLGLAMSHGGAAIMTGCISLGARNERSSHTMHKLSHKTKRRQIRQTRQNRRHHLKRKAHRHRQKLASLNND